MLIETLSRIEIAGCSVTLERITQDDLVVYEARAYGDTFPGGHQSRRGAALAFVKEAFDRWCQELMEWARTAERDTERPPAEPGTVGWLREQLAGLRPDLPVFVQDSYSGYVHVRELIIDDGAVWLSGDDLPES